MAGGSKKPKTPEYEKVAARNAQRMLDLGQGYQGKVLDGYLADVKRETGHREAGATSADISSLAAAQVKRLRGNPMAVAEHSSNMAASQSLGALTARNTAAIGGTSRLMGGAKGGLAGQTRTLQGQSALARIANDAEMRRFQERTDKRSQLINAGSVAAAYGVNKAGESGKINNDYWNEQNALDAAYQDQLFGSGSVASGPSRRFANGRKR